MFFTQEDYRKIEKWLTANSRKDTDFVGATTPLKGNETVVLVQDGKNVKTSVKDIVDQFFLLGVSDFLNITDKYGESYISIDQAIQLIPFRSRKEGQVITFLNTDGNWEIYQFIGKLNQWNNPTLWNNPFDWEKFIFDSILPDEEDLTKSAPDANGNAYLSLKDREYNPESFSGLGRVILRKNIVEIDDLIYGKVTKNILFQDMITQSNTIYEIRYDFDLNGAEITIPEGCALKFEGGSISNGCLYGNSTVIYTELHIIFKELEFKGIWDIPKVYPDWFGIIYNNESIDNTKSIKAAVLLSKQTIQHTIAFNAGDIWVNTVTDKVITDSSDVDTSKNKVIELYSGCTILMKDTTYIKVIPNASMQYSVICGKSVNNIIIKGGHIIGDVKNHIGTTGEWGFGINFKGVTNSVIDSVDCSYCWGDGIMLEDCIDPLKPAIEDRWCDNIQITNCVISYNRRNNLSITSANNVLVENCDIYLAGSINGTAPQNGVDVEPWFDSQKCNDIRFYNTKIHNNYSYQMQLWGYNSDSYPTNITNIKIHNCDISYQQELPFTQSLLPLVIRAKDVKITNSNISGLKLSHADRLTVSNSHLGNIIVHNNDGDISTLLKDINIDNNVFENIESWFNQNNPIFTINENIESINISNNVFRSTTNAGLINFGENVTTYKNIIFNSNIIDTKIPTVFNGAKAINNIVKNPGVFCQSSVPYLCSFYSNLSALDEDYIVNLTIPRIDNIYTIYIKSVWTDIQRPEFSKIVIHIGYGHPKLLEFIDGNSFVPISIIYTENNTAVISFAKSNSSSQIRFEGFIEAQNPFEASIDYIPNTNNFRVPLTPIIPEFIVSSELPTNPYLGKSCFYTSLGKPVWWNGSNWVDATGTPV